MSSVDLTPLDRAFQGAVPSTVTTCSPDGEVNTVFVSQLYRVDREHVAISEQFMRRTNANLASTRRAVATAIDAASGAEYRLTLEYVRRETEGPVVDRMRVMLAGIAKATGMGHVFAIRAALVCRVTSVTAVTAPHEGAGGAPASEAPGLAQVGRIAERLHSAADLGALTGALLDELRDSLGFPHAVLMVLDEVGEKLVTLDSRGFEASGVGSEVRVGEGLLGQCAQHRGAVRIGWLWREEKYARMSAAGGAHDDVLPGLPDAESLLAVPVMTRDALVGLLMLQSRRVAAFTAEDELAVSIVARLVAPLVQRAMRDEGAVAVAQAKPEPTREPVALAAAGATPLAVRYFEETDSVFVDGEYVVRGVAGRILWLVLCDHVERGRECFTARELRLDPRLGLSALNDNLEARMLLLRRRLAERSVPLGIPATARGRFRLALGRPVSLERVPVGRV